MTQVICSAWTCEHNKDKICQLPVIELKESDLEWKDCGQGKERKADTPQTDIHGLTDCDFCKGKNCEDCEGGKDEPQTEEEFEEPNYYDPALWE